MGSTPIGGSEKSFSEYFDLRTLLRYLHLIQVTIHLKFKSVFKNLPAEINISLEIVKSIHTNSDKRSFYLIFIFSALNGLDLI